MRMRVILVLAATVSCAQADAVTSTPPPPPPPPPQESAPPAEDADVAMDERAEQVTRMLTGRFDSTAQAARDPSYLEISLVTCAVDVSAIGPRALYVEQARVGSAPYRQRVYVIEGIDAESARSRVFELAAPKASAGLCERPGAHVFEANELVERTGCDVELRWNGDHFVGGTTGRSCPSDLNGASYATSEIELREDRMLSWDRGFDDRGAQRWGADKGPYEFVRKETAR